MPRHAAIHGISVVLLIGALCNPLLHGQSLARGESAERYLPADVSVVLTVRNVGEHWREIKESELFLRICQVPDVRQALDGEKLRELRMGQKFVEGIFGLPLDQLLQDISHDGATLGWKSEREFVLMAKPDGAIADRLIKTLKELVRATSLLDGKKGPQELFAANYRGIKAFGIDQARIAFCKGWVVVSSSSEIGKLVLDRLLGDSAASLGDKPWFQKAREFANERLSAGTSAAVAIVNLEKIRAESHLQSPRGIDPGKEFILGGILDSIDSAPFAVAATERTAGTFALRVGAPRIRSDDGRSDYFFGAPDVEPAQPPVDLPDRILSARWHRDIGLFWKMAPQLINDENALAGIAKAESDISTLLGGMVTVSDVFQYLSPDIELIAVQPTANAAGGLPAIRLPAFGLTGRLRDPEKAQPALRLAFQQVVSFANLNAAAGSYPPMEVLAERDAEQTLVTATHIHMGRATMTGAPGTDLYKNFSPALGFRGDRFVLATRAELAKQILAAGPVSSAHEDRSRGVDNTIIELWPAELVAIGRLNREPLISQRMLSTGQDRDFASAHVDAILGCLESIAAARLRLQANTDALVIELDVHFADDSITPK